MLRGNKKLISGVQQGISNEGSERVRHPVQDFNTRNKFYLSEQLFNILYYYKQKSVHGKEKISYCLYAFLKSKCMSEECCLKILSKQFFLFAFKIVLSLSYSNKFTRICASL